MRKRQLHTGCRSAFSNWVQWVLLVSVLYDWVSICDLNFRLQVELTEGQMLDWYQSHGCIYSSSSWWDVSRDIRNLF
jgi:hypothetical protein